MPDRDKVICGLERCKLMNKVNCDKCPYDYNGRGNGKSECTAELSSDALALIKKQQGEHILDDFGRCFLNALKRQLDMKLTIIEMLITPEFAEKIVELMEQVFDTGKEEEHGN